ncbi:hypothetical protein [Nonomuraea longicatena]|uniref:Transposase n=1 Tax=Nonomuraea longicatena TaxID=83682 RepID=A0ABN1PXN8_9ACTN
MFRALIGEAQYDPQVAAALNERFITPQADKTVARLKAARDQGHRDWPRLSGRSRARHPAGS